MLPPAAGDDWVALSDEVLPVAAAFEWATRPDCGAVVLFAGTVRDHADGRDGVEHLEYEAYDDAARRRFGEIVAEARRRWPSLGRIAALHRIGRLELSEVAVVVVASAPHRDAAFEAGRYMIDTLKETAPIWKHETWRTGADWGTGATPIRRSVDDAHTVGGSPP